MYTKVVVHPPIVRYIEQTSGDVLPYSLLLLRFEQQIMKFFANVVMITTLGITVAGPVKRRPNPSNPDCLRWIDTTPSCNVSPVIVHRVI